MCSDVMPCGVVWCVLTSCHVRGVQGEPLPARVIGVRWNKMVSLDLMESVQQVGVCMHACDCLHVIVCMYVLAPCFSPLLPPHTHPYLL